MVSRISTRRTTNGQKQAHTAELDAIPLRTAALVFLSRTLEFGIVHLYVNAPSCCEHMSRLSAYLLSSSTMSRCSSSQSMMHGTRVELHRGPGRTASRQRNPMLLSDVAVFFLSSYCTNVERISKRVKPLHCSVMPGGVSLAAAMRCCALKEKLSKDMVENSRMVYRYFLTVL